MAGRMGTWTADEEFKLKAAVQTHGGKNWNKIAAMVPGRTKIQCRNRWHDALNPNIALTARRTGTWTEDEDLKLKAAVQMHGGKNCWNAIAAMVPGRTSRQCCDRWLKYMDSNRSTVRGK
jgi:myb proto-oncogene protein